MRALRRCLASRARRAPIFIGGRLATALVLLLMAGSVGAMEVRGLRCEYRRNPLGIDAPRPRLSWVLEPAGSDAAREVPRGVQQTAYQVLVATTAEKLARDEGDLWDSGKVESHRSLAVEYAGAPLNSGQSVFWKVRCWLTVTTPSLSTPETPTPWSEPATFSMGKLRPEDWRGQWIGASDPEHPRKNPHGALYLRKEFSLQKPVRRASVCFCGLGFSELYVDGTKVGEYVIGPGFTTYDKRTQYLVFEVTDLFRTPGDRKLDVILADGWYALEKDPWVHKFHTKPYVDRPKLLLNLHLEYEDGTETVVVSDESWRWSEGEITRSWIAQEDIDRREAGESRREWKPVTVVQGPAGRLVCQKEPFNRIVETIRPVSLSYDPATKTALWDFGREITGWVRFGAAGPAGSVLTITAISENGSRRASQFTFAGTGGKEGYEPRFCNVGMRRLEVTGLVEAPAQEDLIGCQISSLVEPAGGFACSDALQMALHEAVRRTAVSYTTFLPNDPVREWKAWTQDIQNFFWSMTYLFDSRTMYERWQGDLLDGQADDGNCPNIAPGPGYDDFNSPWWGGCVVWLPWQWYLYYGDDTLLRQSYPAMKRYVDFLGTRGNNSLQDWGLFDWLPVEETPRPIINTPAYFHYAQIVSRTAQLLGHEEDTQHYARLAERVQDAFNREYLDAATGIYGQVGWTVRRGNWKLPVPLEQVHEIWWKGDRPCTQAGQVLPLALGLTPPESRGAVEQALLKELAAHQNRVSTGFVSTPYLLRLLADLDPELGWKMTSSREFPSWYTLTFGRGGDLMKETWAGGMALMPSLGGNLAAWHMESLAGIRPDPAGPGFQKFVVQPNLVGDLQWVESWYDSGYGRIVSNWKREGEEVHFELTVPPNTTATVSLPARETTTVLEGGRAADQAEGVQFVRREKDRAVYRVGSGHYRFRTTCQEPKGSQTPTP